MKFSFKILRITLRIIAVMAFCLSYGYFTFSIVKLDSNWDIPNYLFSMLFPFFVAVWIFYLFPKWKNAITSALMSGMLIFFYLIELFFLVYLDYTEKTTHFDPFFFFYNISDSWGTLTAVVPHFYLIVLVVSFFTVINFFNLYELFGRFPVARKTGSWKGPFLTTFIIIAVGYLCIQYPGEYYNVYRIATEKNTQLARLYDSYYLDSIHQNRQFNITEGALDADDPNLFMVQLESVSHYAMKEELMPELRGLAQEHGVLIPNVQASSVQTVRGQASILCGILPSSGQSLSRAPGLTEDLNCLPEVMRSQGYKTLFFKSHDLEFQKTGDFMKRIGFDEVHGEDIMQEGDLALEWGYRDDIFYQRVFEYLEQYKDEKIFVYIAVSGTNHIPFYQQDDENFPEFKGRVPYPENEEDIGLMSYYNSLWIQDVFYGYMVRNYFLPTYGENSYLWTFSDTAWPVGIHEGNFHNENSAYQEDFLTLASILLPQQKKGEIKTGLWVNRLISQMDFYATILDLYGLSPSPPYSISFYPDLIEETEEQGSHCVTSVQPYGDTFIVQIKYPVKCGYDVYKDRVVYYDLENDPLENRPINIHAIKDEDIELFSSCYEEMKSQ